jgi:hypothetical protein
VEAYRSDWSHEIALLNGVTVAVKDRAAKWINYVRLYHRRMRFFRTYPRETQEMAFALPAASPFQRAIM